MGYFIAYATTVRGRDVNLGTVADLAGEAEARAKVDELAAAGNLLAADVEDGEGRVIFSWGE